MGTAEHLDCFLRRGLVRGVSTLYLHGLMFSKSAGGGGAIVTVGIPRHVPSDGSDYAYESQIGGVPSWHDRESSFTGRLSCRSCGADDTMLMVAQIYAPVDCERSLYVFCCNKRGCSLRDEGWKVLRNQAQFKASPPSTSKSKTGEEKEEHSDSIWGGLGTDLNMTENFASLALGDDDPGGTEDLLAMLEARDNAIDHQKNQKDLKNSRKEKQETSKTNLASSRTK